MSCITTSPPAGRPDDLNNLRQAVHTLVTGAFRAARKKQAALKEAAENPTFAAVQQNCEKPNDSPTELESPNQNAALREGASPDI